MHERWRKDERVVSVGPVTARVAVNAGLWFEDPDVDAVTRLTNDIVAVEYARSESFILQVRCGIGRGGRGGEGTYYVLVSSLLLNSTRNSTHETCRINREVVYMINVRI